MADNQAILKKALEKLQTSEARVKQQNEQLRQREVQITNSIRAAYTIQQSILPENHKLHFNFSEYFVIYKPRDVVSGDFYWVDTFRNKVFVAAVDCTGHGVPGAFMSLIGNSLLNVIIKNWRMDHPHEVLAQLHEEVQTLLRQKATGNHYVALSGRL
ncbi:MAG: hypothetical protein HC913_10710 [Microscillaceae bacterium]|nr:hypothetical protein [Microscillaceae bacterium]